LDKYLTATTDMQRELGKLADARLGKNPAKKDVIYVHLAREKIAAALQANRNHPAEIELTRSMELVSFPLREQEPDLDP